MNQLLLPGNAPFVVAIGLMVLIGVLEALALLLGLGLSQQADSFLVTHFAIDHSDASDASDASAADAGAIGQFLGWLHVGRVPLLMLVVLFLMGFAIVGLVLQWVLAAAAGHLLPVPVAVVLATLGALPFVRMTGGLVGQYFPQDESSAVSELDFVGRVAQVTVGEASSGNPAEARLVDEYGQPHYIRVEPDVPGQRFPRGETVLIVARASGTLYRAMSTRGPTCCSGTAGAASQPSLSFHGLFQVFKERLNQYGFHHLLGCRRPGRRNRPVHHRPDLLAPVHARLRRTRLRAYRPGRAKGDHERRRHRAAGVP